MRKALKIAGVAAAVAATFGLGMATSAGQVVERVVEKPVDKIVTRNVEVTPTSCRTALDLSEEALSLSNDLLGYEHEVAQGGLLRDYDRVDKGIAGLKLITSKLEALKPQLLSAKELCRR